MEPTLNLNLSVQETELLLKSLQFYTSSIANKVKVQAEAQLKSKTPAVEEKESQG